MFEHITASSTSNDRDKKKIFFRQFVVVKDSIKNALKNSCLSACEQHFEVRKNEQMNALRAVAWPFFFELDVHIFPSTLLWPNNVMEFFEKFSV